jgi:hypothetical protein
MAFAGSSLRRQRSIDTVDRAGSAYTRRRRFSEFLIIDQFLFDIFRPMSYDCAGKGIATQMENENDEDHA